MSHIRHYSFFDRLCMSVDQAIKTLSGNLETTNAIYPAKNLAEDNLSPSEKKLSANLMRVNHAGEICAQALYHGQGLVSRTDAVQIKMREAAIEEGDHLDWCQKRIIELGSHTSYLNPFWYAGSFAIGTIAGAIGDAWSLGFIVETERQVIKHLQGHCEQLPQADKRSNAILQRMEQDEAKHRDEALAEGARELPSFVKIAMNMISKVMVKISYLI